MNRCVFEAEELPREEQSRNNTLVLDRSSNNESWRYRYDCDYDALETIQQILAQTILWTDTSIHSILLLGEPCGNPTCGNQQLPGTIVPKTCAAVFRDTQIAVATCVAIHFSSHEPPGRQYFSMIYHPERNLAFIGYDPQSRRTAQRHSFMIRLLPAGECRHLQIGRSHSTRSLTFGSWRLVLRPTCHSREASSV